MRIVYSVASLITATLLLSSTPTMAQQIQLSPVVSGLASPVFVGNADDNLSRLFIVERAGVIKVLQPGESTPTTFLDIRAKIVAGGEQGPYVARVGEMEYVQGVARTIRLTVPPRFTT